MACYNVRDTFGQLFFVGEEATLDNLGKDNKLVWVSPDEALITNETASIKSK